MPERMVDVIHICVAMKPVEGTFAENALENGVAGLNIDGSRIETVDNLDGGAYAENPTHRAGQDMWTRERKGDTNCFKRGGAGNFNQPTGRFPANLIHDGSEKVVEVFPESNSNDSPRNRQPRRDKTQYRIGGDYETNEYGDKGGASRFF